MRDLWTRFLDRMLKNMELFVCEGFYPYNPLTKNLVINSVQQEIVIEFVMNQCLVVWLFRGVCGTKLNNRPAFVLCRVLSHVVVSCYTCMN